MQQHLVQYCGELKLGLVILEKLKKKNEEKHSVNQKNTTTICQTLGKCVRPINEDPSLKNNYA